MTVTPDLVCVGHIVQEMIHFPDRVAGPVLGGPPAYCSVAAARQGTCTGLVTRIGADMEQTLLDPFLEAGVDTTGLDCSGVTSRSELIYSENGNKEIRYPAKAAPLKVADVPRSYHDCAMLYVCTMDNDVLPEDLADVVSVGRCSAVDLGGYGGVHMSRKRRGTLDSVEAFACAVAEQFIIVKASDEDAKAIFGSDDPDEAGDRLLRCGPEVVIITGGARGAFVYAKKNRWQLMPATEKAIDATGGGDSFMAGFLCEFLRSGDPLASARWGTATACCVIEKSGGVHPVRMPTEEQVRERVKNTWSNA